MVVETVGVVISTSFGSVAIFQFLLSVTVNGNTTRTTSRSSSNRLNVKLDWSLFRRGTEDLSWVKGVITRRCPGCEGGFQ